MPGGPAVELRGVSVVRGQTTVLADIDWTVLPGERWVLLGPNGAGKTTLLQIVTGYLHPTRGTASVLGHRLGTVDVRELRKRIAVASGALLRMLDARLTAREIVRTGRSASLAPWWDHDDADEEVQALLDDVGLTAAADRPFGALSEGERQRVLLARMRLARAGLWVFDEPAAGLDLGARERLITTMAALAGTASTPPILFVTHHVEEIPPGFTHVLLLRQGRVLAAGPIQATLTGPSLSACFDVDVDLAHRSGRWTATSVPPA